MKQRADEGDRDAQYSQGCELMGAAGGYTGVMGAAGRSPKANVGLALYHTTQFPVARMAEMLRRCVT